MEKKMLPATLNEENIAAIASIPTHYLFTMHGYGVSQSSSLSEVQGVQADPEMSDFQIMHAGLVCELPTETPAGNLRSRSLAMRLSNAVGFCQIIQNNPMLQIQL